MKRAIDLVMGVLLCVVALPVVMVLALAVGVSLRTGRVFFVQDRVGKDGRPFTFLKLRTLPVSAPAYACKTEIAPEAGNRLLQFMRRTHLDELPQLLLVPLGRLSLVGPRPKMPDGHEPVHPVYNHSRTRVAQGCTGLWQISSANGSMPHDAPEFDFFYLAHQNLLLDLWILWRTVLMVTGLGGTIEIADVPRWAAREEPIIDVDAHLAAVSGHELAHTIEGVPATISLDRAIGVPLLAD